ncbi:MAG: gas vesicle protein GvpA [Acidobacteria bacterium]|jgi:hypothetical protein|nr:MAG: gas vesicle protein GvpA [Acidobacteriota bacterium]
MVRRATREAQMVDLLDRILDKGIVVDAWGRVFLAGVDFGISWEARMVVASIDTYLKHAGAIGLLDSVAWRFARRNLALNPG